MFSQLLTFLNVLFSKIVNFDKLKRKEMLFQSSLGSISDLIDYFNLNKQIFEKQRNSKQHMQRIMAMLTQENMKILQKQFQLYTKGLQLPTFIYLMKKLYIPQDELSDYYFVSDLIKFFQAIDVNGDGHLEWSEFTEYIIDNIRRVERPNYKNKTFEENEIISSAYSKISNQYKITKVIETGASNCIKKIIYLKKQSKYFVLEAASDAIKVFNQEFAKIDEFSLRKQNQTAHIIDFSFDQENQIFCALFEGSARYCNIKLAGAIKFINEVEQKKLKNYHKVEYLPGHELWAFLSKNGEIKYSKASYKSRTQMTYRCEHNIKLHEGLVTDILQIDQPKYTVSSSMDGTIKLYSLTLKRQLTFQHLPQESHSIINTKNKKGILGIDYTRQFGSYVLSYGFSTKVNIYSLDNSLTKGYTGKYTQHWGNIISAKFLKSYPYVLSFDDKLNLRIWDFRTFQTIQTINCEKNFINPSRLQIIPELNECLICQKKITQFRAPSLQKKSKEINEFYNIFDFKICSVTNNIFVFTSNDVRVYNYITGALINVFTKLDESSFDTNTTAAQFGYKSRKFFLGDAAGYVREFDSETGEYLQQIKPTDDIQYENKAIVKIIFLKEHSLLIVCTLDGRIMIYERNFNSEFQIIRDIRQSHEQLTCAAASVRYCLLATGCQNGTVNIWNLEKFSIQAVLALQHKIVGIAFSPIHPIMVVVEDTGVLNFFYVRPYENSINRYKCFLKIQNRDQDSVLHQISSFSCDLIINAYLNKKCSLIQEMPQYKHHFIVTLGQKNGQFVVANLNSIIDKFKIEQNHQIFSTKKSIRCQIQNSKSLIASERNKILLIQGYSNSHAQTMSLCEFRNQRRFCGHEQKIDQILLIKENSVILSTSGDRKLKMWSIEGQMNGSIDFFTFKKTSWKVSEINFHKKIQAIETCIYAIKLIENKKFSPKQEEEIKINLLMNEFMDERQRLDYMAWIKVVRRNRYPKIRSRPLSKVRMSKIERENQLKSQRACENTDALGYSSGEDEEMLEDYFRKIRINYPNQKESHQQQHMACQSISNTEFNQIYKKLQTKIKNKLQQQEANKQLQFRPVDINNFITKSKKHSEDHSSKKLKDNLKSDTQKNKHDLVSNLKHALIMPSNAKKKINLDQEFEIDKVLRKPLYPKRQVRQPLKKQSNLLFQNLSEARKKINIMTRSYNNKSSIFG